MATTARRTGAALAAAFVLAILAAPMVAVPSSPARGSAGVPVVNSPVGVIPVVPSGVLPAHAAKLQEAPARLARHQRDLRAAAGLLPIAAFLVSALWLVVCPPGRRAGLRAPRLTLRLRAPPRAA